MKMEDVIAKIVMEFGTKREQKNCDKVTALFTKVAGDRDVSIAIVSKVANVGRQLKKLGIS